MKKYLVVATLASVLLTACSNGGNSGNVSTNAPTGTPTESTQSGSNEKAKEEPIEVSIMTHFHGATPPDKEGPVQKAIEEATNTTLNIQWNSANNYLDKLNVSIASQQLADLVLIPNSVPLDNNVFVQAVKNDIFWDLTPYIEYYPNIKNKIAEVAWDSNKIDGKNYFIPRPRTSESDWFFVFRKDWLDNLGLSVPTTDEELYEVMKAFTYNDPDGNGKDDTTGFTGHMWTGSFGDYKSFESLFTSANGDWKEENGSLVYSAFDEGERKAIEFLKKAYDEGLIIQDFASVTNDQKTAIFTGGKAGVLIYNSATFPTLVDVISQHTPDFDLMDLIPATAINGYTPKSVGFNGGNAIPKTVPEEKMKRILSMINAWMEDDIFAMHSQGIEGIHHTLENGKVVIDTEKVVADGLAEYTQIVFVANEYGNAYREDYPEEAITLFKNIQEERAKVSTAPFVGLASETGSTYLPEVIKDLNDMKIKIILGHEPISSWDALVTKLQNDPKMQQTIKEINESYQGRK